MRILIIILSFNLYGSEMEAIKLAKSFVQSVREADTKKLAKISSSKFYAQFKSKIKQKETGKEKELDYKIKSSPHDQSIFLVNFKDKTKRNYDHHWLRIKNNKIDGFVTLD